MLEEFWFNVNYGINHVLDVNALDHLLFLMVLTVPYIFKDWKRVLLLVSVFTIGHTLSLVLAAYNIVSINDAAIEFLIPLTILVVAIYNIFRSRRLHKQDKIGLLFLSAFFFGLIHGFGFAREFKLFIGIAKSILKLLIEFALGIEIAQICIVFFVLFLGYIGQTIFKVSKRNWVIVISVVVVGLVIPMVVKSDLLS